MRFSFFAIPFICCLLFAGARISIAAPEGAVIEMGSRGVSNFIARMEKEREAHVLFLGGSITEKKTGHSQMAGDWLKEKWPDVDFTFTNAGLSSTCSVSGAFRLSRDVLAKGGVDLLVVEFAVNDDQDAGHDRKTAIRGLEGVIRQYFQANPKGDVISVQFVNPSILEKFQEGETAVSVGAHKEVARHYDVPIVDVGLALAKEIEAGSMTWKENYGGTHPNGEGYTFATKLITQVIEDTISGETPQIVSLPEPLDPGSYFSASTMDPQQMAWLGGWKFAPVSRDLLPVGQIRSQYEKYEALRSDESGNHLYGTFSGTMLGAFVLAGPDAGTLEVCIDGGEWKPVELYHHYSSGLNYPRSVILADDLADQFHSVAIRVSDEKNPKSKGNTATILRFQVN
jgi:lysophospholipase L1-like esterase